MGIIGRFFRNIGLLKPNVDTAVRAELGNVVKELLQMMADNVISAEEKAALKRKAHSVIGKYQSAPKGVDLELRCIASQLLAVLSDGTITNDEFIELKRTAYRLLLDYGFDIG
jgi:hypothetical protein